jgi:hypothetical protein
MRVLALLALLFLSAPVLAEDGPGGPTAPRLAALKADVEWLAAPERMGRHQWEHREACAAWLAKAFEAAGLAHAPGLDAYHLDHGRTPPPGGPARNVIGWLPGAGATADPKAPGPYVILSAHYDHLGARRPAGPDGVPLPAQVFAGADDNATGTAALLEVARILCGRYEAGAPRPACSILFVAFDKEEQRTLGSQGFVDAPPLPLKDCRAFVTVDMLGRSLMDLLPGSLFVMGTEHAPELQALVEGVQAPDGARMLPLGIDFQPGYSDYVPFASKQIPYVFITSGACADYHTTRDTADKIEWPQLASRTGYVLRLAETLAASSASYAWSTAPAYHPGEVKALYAAMTEIQKRLPELGLPKGIAVVLQNFIGTMDKVLADDEVTKAERMQVQRLTATIFRMAQQLQTR